MLLDVREARVWEHSGGTVGGAGAEEEDREDLRSGVTGAGFLEQS